MKKKIIIAILGVVIVVLGFVFVGAYRKYAVFFTQKKIVERELGAFAPSLPTFTNVALDFVHAYQKDSYAFAGSALIDIDGDGVEEVFIGGGDNQFDGLFRFENGRFANIAAGRGFTNKTPAGGALSIDVDNDGDADLFVARLDGVYLYLNNAGSFSEQKLDIVFEKDAVPMSFAAADINKDGLVDLYISTFKSPKVFTFTTFNNPANRSKNIMMLNKGGNNFEDITEKAGLAYSQNTFQATFVDLNNDTWQDLVISPNTDKVFIYENKKNGTFQVKPPLTDFGFWMGLAVGDIDNDGDQDLFLSNIGNSVPVASARGDLRPDQVLDANWALLRNDGGFKFTSITKAKKFDDYEFAWGALFEDLNLDGLQDLLVVENYIKLPAHKLKKLDGRVLLQENNGDFSPITKAAGLENPYYGTSPLVADFNKDGYPDVVFVNFSGESRAFINNGGNDNHIKVSLPDRAKYLGTRVDVEKLDGSKISKQIIGGIGLMADISNELIFGIGGDSTVKTVTATLPDGTVKTSKNVKMGSHLRIQ